MSIKSVIKSGLELAGKDYQEISRRSDKFDVKPKEDQIKSALYKNLTDKGYLVHLEASYERNGRRCDLLAIKGKKIIAVEIKTAWAGTGWVNKPAEQAASWRADIEKLQELGESGLAQSGYFILCFAYEKGAGWESTLRNHISDLGFSGLARFEISEWNGLTEIEFFLKKVI